MLGLLVLAASGSLASAPLAAKEPKPLRVLGPLSLELSEQGALTGDADKALRQADRCIDSDKQWERAQVNEVPLTQLYETLSSAVVCWQDAEKKGEKLGESYLPAQRWVAARARYVEAYRSFVWAGTAKREGDLMAVCKRLTESMRIVGDANTAAAAMTGLHTSPESQALAAALDQSTRGLGEAIADEFEHQKCK
jgi:hypothetical protein